MKGNRNKGSNEDLYIHEDKSRGQLFIYLSAWPLVRSPGLIPAYQHTLSPPSMSQLHLVLDDLSIDGLVFTAQPAAH